MQVHPNPPPPPTYHYRGHGKSVSSGDTNPDNTGREYLGGRSLFSFEKVLMLWFSGSLGVYVLWNYVLYGPSDIIDLQAVFQGCWIALFKLPLKHIKFALLDMRCYSINITTMATLLLSNLLSHEDNGESNLLSCIVSN